MLRHANICALIITIAWTLAFSTFHFMYVITEHCSDSWRLSLSHDCSDSWRFSVFHDCSNSWRLLVSHDCSNSWRLSVFHDCSDSWRLLVSHDCSNSWRLSVFHDCSDSWRLLVSHDCSDSWRLSVLVVFMKTFSITGLHEDFQYYWSSWRLSVLHDCSSLWRLSVSHDCSSSWRLFSYHDMSAVLWIWHGDFPVTMLPCSTVWRCWLWLHVTALWHLLCVPVGRRSQEKGNWQLGIGCAWSCWFSLQCALVRWVLVVPGAVGSLFSVLWFLCFVPLFVARQPCLYSPCVVCWAGC